MISLVFIGFILNQLGMLNGWVLGLYIAAWIIKAIIKVIKLSFVVWIFEEI